MNKFLLSAFLLYATAATSQNAVVSVKDKDSNSKDDAVASYFLPKSVLEIEVVAVNNKFKAGPYANEAKRYFGTSAEQQDKDAWEVKEIRIKQVAEPDPAQRYKVYATSGSTGSLVSLTEKEILLGVNLPLGFSAKQGQEDRENFGNRRRGKGRHNNMPREMEDSGFRTNFKYKDNDSTAEVSNAEFAYNLINSLRSTRADLIQSDGSDAQNFDAYLKGIDKEEKELSALFFGKTTIETQRATFAFSPDKEGNNQEVCKFSSKNGFSESGEAITISIKKKSVNTKVNNTSGKTGYVYRVPAMADVEIKMGKTVFWKSTLEIPQLGTTESLPAGFFDKNDLKALFDKETGALLQISK